MNQMINSTAVTGDWELDIQYMLGQYNNFTHMSTLLGLRMKRKELPRDLD